MRILALVAGFQMLLLSPAAALGEDPTCPHHFPGAPDHEHATPVPDHQDHGLEDEHHPGHDHPHGHDQNEHHSHDHLPGSSGPQGSSETSASHDSHEGPCECPTICAELVGPATPEIPSSPTSLEARTTPFAELLPEATHLPGIIPHTIPFSRPPPASFQNI